MADPYAGIASPVQAPAQGDPYAGIASPVQHGHGLIDQAVDWAKSAGSGLVSGLAGLADMAPGGVGGAVMGAQLGNAIVEKVTGHKVPGGGLPSLMPQTAQQQAAPLGADYAPHTTAGRYVKSVATMAPNAVLGGGESLIPKAASVLLPGVLSQGGADAAQAMGGGQTVQNLARLAGGILGGVGASRVNGAVNQPEAILSASEQPVAKSIDAALFDGQTTPDALQAKLQNGVLPPAADPGLAQLGEYVATQPGQGGILLRQATAARMGTQTDRALGAVNDILGVDPETAHGNVDQIVASGQKAAAPLYDQIRANPAPVWSADLAALAQRPSIVKAINVAANGILDAGGNPRTAGMALDPDTGSWVLPTSGSLEGSTELQPTAETWDAVYKGIGGAVERHPLTGAPLSNSVSTNNANLDAARRDLRDAMTAAIPGYGDALATSGDYLSTSGAFTRASGKVLSSATPVYDFGKLWASLKSPAEQNAARAAIANDVLTASDKGKFEPGLFKSPGVQDKLAIAFGPDKASQFIDQMEADTAERNVYNNMTGNSRTSSRESLKAAYGALDPNSGGLLGAARKVTSLANTAASFTHPLTAVTKLADMGTHVGGGGAQGAILPWENPQVTAQLGGLLSDPQAFSSFLEHMAAARNAAAQPQPILAGLLQPQIAGSAGIAGLLGYSGGTATQQPRP